MNLEDQYDRIYKYLFFRLHDKHTAEDLTQEAFLRFLGSRTYRDEDRQLQYLYTIARNLCSQYYRDRVMTQPGRNRRFWKMHSVLLSRQEAVCC